MVDSQKRRPSERDNICPSFSSTSFKLTIPQFHYMTVKSLGFLLDSILSMENFICQIAKSATTSSVELVLPGSIFPPRLQWNCHGHLAHSVKPWLPQFSLFWPACFLCPKPLSHTKLCCSPHTEKTRKTDHITPVSIFPRVLNRTMNSVQNIHSLL